MEQNDDKLEFSQLDILAMGIPQIDPIQPVGDVDRLLERANSQDRLARSDVADTGLFAGAALSQFLTMRHRAQLRHPEILTLIEQLIQIKHSSVAAAAEEVLRAS